MSERFYNATWVAARLIYGLVFPGRVHGLENLPREGGFVLCINHVSARDPFFISCRIPRRRRMVFMAKKELLENRLTRPVVKALDSIPVDRGNADLSAVRSALRVIRDGMGLGIFPQGTRSRDNTPTPMLNGASMIALRGGVPIIPAYIDGPYRLFRRTDIHIGRAIDVSDLGRRVDAVTLDEATHRIEAAVWSLRPALPAAEK